MAKLRCSKCNFKWNSRTAAVPNTCPYCGKDSCIYDEEETGLRDIDELLA
jgi:predicted RNA-binding Zn-ribbon protein involved in translation (DUF1610 family)